MCSGIGINYQSHTHTHTQALAQLYMHTALYFSPCIQYTYLYTAACRLLVLLAAHFLHFAVLTVTRNRFVNVYEVEVLWASHWFPPHVYSGFWLENLKERDEQEDPGVDGTVILDWMLK